MTLHNIESMQQRPAIHGFALCYRGYSIGIWLKGHAPGDITFANVIFDSLESRKHINLLLCDLERGGISKHDFLDLSHQTSHIPYPSQ